MFDFATGASHRAVDHSKIVAHGVLMTVSWALLFPVGVFFAAHRCVVACLRTMILTQLWMALIAKLAA